MVARARTMAHLASLAGHTLMIRPERRPGARLGATADRGSVCRHRPLHVPDLICSGDPIWPVKPRPQGQPCHHCHPWNMEALRKLYAFGDAEQRAWAASGPAAAARCPMK
jgi:hypothetical protein